MSSTEFPSREIGPIHPDIPDGGRADENPPFGFSDVALIALFAVVCLFFFAALAIGIAAGAKGVNTPAQLQELAKRAVVIFPAQIAAYFAVIGFMVLIVRRRTAEAFSGAVRWKWPANAPRFILAGLIMAILIQWASAHLPVPESVPMQQYFRDRQSAIILALFGIAVAPLMEELFFRGFLYPVIARYNRVLPILFTAISFAFIHQAQLAKAWAPLLLLFIVGLVLTLIRAYTRSVAASWIAHAAYNATLFGMFFAATHGFRDLEKFTR